MAIASRVCINSRHSRRPSVKVVNQNGSVQLGEKAAEYYLGCALIRNLQGDHQLKLRIKVRFSIKLFRNKIISRGLCTFIINL